jgi:putative hydrolase of the HAD superfamily
MAAPAMLPHPSRSAVVFDLDETLIDAVKGLRAAHENVTGMYLSICGGKKDRIIAELSRLDDEMNRRTEYDRGRWWQLLAERLGSRISLSAYARKALTESYWESYEEAATPYDDADEVLQYLRGRGYLLGIITDTDGTPGAKRARIDRLRFRNLFATIVIAGEDTMMTKPDPEPFLLAAHQLGVHVSSCVFVGDKPFADINGAKAAGMGTVLVKRRSWGSGEMADQTIGQLTDLKALL